MDAVKLRYGLYGFAILSLGAAYYWLAGSPEADRPAAERAASRRTEDLPVLHFALPGSETKITRDIFAYLAAPAPVAAVVREPVPEEPPAKVTDRFADLHVLGMVARNGERAFLIRAGSQMFTVQEGDRFGEDEALGISNIDGPQISIDDNVAGVSKTFMLSEE